MKAALHKMKTTPGYTREDAIDERIAFFEYQIRMESTTLKVEKKLLAEITDLKQQLEDMNSDIVATEAEDLEHVDPEQVAQKEQAAVSKKKPATKLRSRLRFMSRRKTLEAQETKLSSDRNTSGSVWSRPRLRLSRSACTLE